MHTVNTHPSRQTLKLHILTVNTITTLTFIFYIAQFNHFNHALWVAVRCVVSKAMLTVAEGLAYRNIYELRSFYLKCGRPRI